MNAVPGFINLRGDISGLFFFLVVLFLGLWQVVVAWKRINGLSITGYPDRRLISFAMGLILVIGSGLWYYSRPFHFNHPDVEGLEMVFTTAMAAMAATVIQFAISSIVFTGRGYRNRNGVLSHGMAGVGFEEEYGTCIEVAGSQVPALFFPVEHGEYQGRAPGVVLLHEFGGDRFDLAPLGLHLSRRGIPALALDLDGHGDNTRPLSFDAWDEPVSDSLLWMGDNTQADRLFLIGWGWSANLALLYAGRAAGCSVIAIEPLPLEDDEYAGINALRELTVPESISNLSHRRKRGSNGVRSAPYPAELLFDSGWPPASLPDQGRLHLLNGEGTWYMGPEERRAASESLPRHIPEIVTGGSHGVIPYTEESLDAIVQVINECP